MLVNWIADKRTHNHSSLQDISLHIWIGFIDADEEETTLVFYLSISFQRYLNFVNGSHDFSITNPLVQRHHFIFFINGSMNLTWCWYDWLSPKCWEKNQESMVIWMVISFITFCHDWLFLSFADNIFGFYFENTRIILNLWIEIRWKQWTSSNTKPNTHFNCNFVVCFIFLINSNRNSQCSIIISCVGWWKSKMFVVSFRVPR